MSASTQVLESNRPIRCLFIQLARLEDTLQSLMALRAAKQLYPNLEIHFLARDRFAVAAKRVPWIASVTTLPTAELIGPYMQGRKSETQTIAELARWIAPILKDPWDIVVNWSFSEPSSYLTALIPSRIKLGFTRRQDSTFSINDGWSQYIQAIVQGGIHQNIHLIDILTTQLLTALQIHLGDPKDHGNLPVTSKSFFAMSPEGKPLEKFIKESKQAWISFQLGNRRANQRWNPLSWARLAHLITKRHPHYGVFLLGEKSEQDEVRQLLKQLDPSMDSMNAVVPVASSSNFDLWSTAIGRSHFLIGGDSSAIQLASVLGTKIIQLAIGQEQPAETGPYGNGHYVMVPNHKGQRTEADITPESVYAVWSYAAEEWIHQRQFSIETHFSQLGFTADIQVIQVFRSKIRSTKDGGGVFYEPMTIKPIQINDWVSMVVGHMARSWYCGWTPPIGQEMERKAFNPAFIQQLRALKESCDVLSKICDQACQTALAINKRSTNLKSNKIMNIHDKEDLKRLGTTLIELESLIERLTKLHPELSSFSQMSKVLMYNLNGAHLTDLGKEAANCYKQLNEGIAIFKEWIQFSLKMVRPMAVSIQAPSGSTQPAPSPTL